MKTLPLGCGNTAVQLLAGLLAAVLIGSDGAQVVRAGALSPILVSPVNGHRYLLLNTATWSASEEEAVALGGHLATVRSAAEEDWIFNTFGRYLGQSRLLWIGLTDQFIEGKFVWMSGEPVVFDGWAPGEPNSLPAEDFTAIYYPGHSAQNRWNDWGNRTADPIGLPFNGVVELNPGTVIQTLVSTGSVWRYLDDGSNQGTAWRDPKYDDSGWSSGRAQLGYGDGDEATLVYRGPNANDVFITTYFRQRFVPPQAVGFTNLLLRLLRDDGAVVYLNGHELHRSNLPTNGPVLFSTLALSAVGGAEESEFFPTIVPITFLRPGTNVLAVEVHQSSANSTDLGFDAELIGLPDAHWPQLVIKRGATVGLRWPAAAASHTLESSFVAGPTATWTPVEAPLTTNGLFIEAAQLKDSRHRFFRLRR